MEFFSLCHNNKENENAPLAAARISPAEGLVVNAALECPFLNTPSYRMGVL